MITPRHDTETWKSIQGYEGLYEVSNLGNVRSCSRLVIQKSKGVMCKHFYKGRQLAPHKRAKGYLCVHLSKNGNTKWFNIHRLVAEAFVERKVGCNIVNHLDNNPTNNRSNNLEWTTPKGNMQWATKQGRMKYKPENLKKAQEAKKRKIIAIDSKGNKCEFASIAEASRTLLCNRGHISSICKKRYGYKTSNGYTFEYKEA